MGGFLFRFRMVPIISSMLAMRRLDPRELVREAGLPDEALQGEIIAPLVRVQKFLELAAGTLEAPLFGLDLAERIPTGAFGLTEFLMRSAPNVVRVRIARESRARFSVYEQRERRRVSVCGAFAARCAWNAFERVHADARHASVQLGSWRAAHV
jgi:hypothetical protein